MRRHGGLEHGTAEELPHGSGDRTSRLALHRCVAVAVRAAATSTGRIAFTDFGRWSDFLHFQALWRALFPTAVQRMIPRVWGTTSRWATTLRRLLLGFATGTRRQ
jgi:hypothetical protein